MKTDTARRVAAPPVRPLMIYDGSCGFCRLWIERWRALTRERVDYEASDRAAKAWPEIPPETYARSVVLIEPDGSWHTGAEAVARATARASMGGLALKLYRRAPGAAACMEAAYAFVAARRTTFSMLTRLLWGDQVAPAGRTLSRGLYLRLLGLVYLAAFASLWVQIEGLAGSSGILPAGTYLEAAHARLGSAAYWRLPTLCWLGGGDAMLNGLCAAGVLLSILLLLGIAPIVCLPLLWLSYLSLTHAAGVFLRFQWDGLLLETGLIAILLAPAAFRCPIRSPSPPSRLALWLHYWLLFRLMFSSGLVKLAGGDATWRDLTALSHHYETQPLPVWTSWYVHHLPLRLHQISTIAMFVVELGAPLLILAPRRLRHAAGTLMMIFQAAIASTGNYGFFNLLSAALCVLLIDDAAWPARWREGLPPADSRTARARPRWRAPAMALASAPIFVLGFVGLAGALRASIVWPAPIRWLHEQAEPLRSVNGYGLFMVMTTTRPEILVEGSLDGTSWRRYEFRYKPGEPSRPPEFVAPHMPRLDWQMWFAALSDFRSQPWMERFLARLLEGSPQVLGLLENNPFPEGPPRYVRATLYDYRFSEPGNHAGAWWVRRELGLYTPALSLRR